MIGTEATGTIGLREARMIRMLPKDRASRSLS
jgi:hypothetical protein